MSLHFKDSEYYCKFGKCGNYISDKSIRILLEMLHAYLLLYINQALKIRIVITSGNRCLNQNIKSDGSGKSRHMITYGNDACDIRCYAYMDATHRKTVDAYRKNKKRFWKKVDPEIIHNLLDKHFPDTLTIKRQSTS